MNTVAHVVSSVHEIAKRARFRPALGAVVRTVIGGITATGSVVLSELLRPQVAKEDLHAAEQRVSQALMHEAALDDLPGVYLAMAAPEARSLRFRSVDGSDVSKPAGRQFEYLDVVRDSSSKPRDRVVVGPHGVQASRPFRPSEPSASEAHGSVDVQASAPSPPSTSASQDRNARKRTRQRKATSKVEPQARPSRPRTVMRRDAGKERKANRVKVPSPPALKKLGYWMIQIDAGDGTGNHLPLLQDIFSTQDPGYQALGKDAWTMTFQCAIELVLEHVDSGGTWLLDRGFDDVAWMVWLHENVDQNVIRMKSNRLVRPGTQEDRPVNVGRLAETLEARHATQIRYVNKSTHEDEHRIIQFAWAPIGVDSVDHPLYLIVAHTGRKRPLLLVTDRRPESPEESGSLIQAYLERWGNEEVTRACKQLTGLERIRVRSLPAIRRLVWCAMIAIGIQALSILTRPRLRRATLDRTKEFIERVRFVLYRIWRVVREDLLHALNGRPHLFTLRTLLT
jgi:hypothetical protein